MGVTRPPLTPVRLLLARYQQEESRDGGGGAVFVGFGEEAFGGCGLLHTLDHQAVFGHRVHVLRERAVDEGQQHSGCELFHAHVDGEVRADAPVLLFEDVVDHPAAVGRLQQRVIEEEREAAAGREHTSDLGNRRTVIGQVFEHQARDRGVEGRIGERKLLRARPQIVRPARALRGDLDLRARRVDAHHELRTELRREARDLAFAGTDIDDPRRTFETLGRERKDLLLVLRIRAVGEAVLPPLRVALPRVVVATYRAGGHNAG
jgi:hypothetical protein